MHKLLFIPCILFTVACFSQSTPFATRSYSLSKPTIRGNNNTESASFFNAQSLSLVFADGSSNLFPALNSTVINYRLSISSKQLKAADGTDSAIKRTYLPFTMLSNVSTNMGKDNGTLMNDATSYFGSLLSFRITPSFSLYDGLENKLVAGFTNDLRMYAIGDTLQQKLNVAFGYYGAIGLTYFGPGVVEDNENPTKEYDGKWAFSALFYGFKSGGKFNEVVFNNKPATWLTGFEMLLKFKTNADANSKFNFLIGSRYDLSKNSPTYNTWNFRIGIGN